MTLGGWITFLISTGAFFTLFVWCLLKVLTAKRPMNDEETAFELYEGKRKKVKK